MTLDQVDKVLEVIKGHRLETLVIMALMTGMRRDEMLALRWSDIDFEDRIVQIKRSVDYIPKHRYVEDEPKTAAGWRMVVLASPVIDALSAHRVQQLELKLKTGGAWDDKNLVFTDLHGGYFNPRYLEKLFKKFIVENNLPQIHFYDLRHSTAILLLKMGVDMKVIQEILGHSNIAMTANIYAHVSLDMQQDAMRKWDTVMNRKKKQRNI